MDYNVYTLLLPMPAHSYLDYKGKIYTFTVYNDDITKTHGIYNKELDHDVDLQTKGVDLSWERDGTKKNARIIKILKVSSDTYDTSDKGQSSTKQKQVPDGL
ncbi:MAG TPA: hypothetical protein VF884_14460 [Nitrososphaeraceae archaeon]